LRTQRNSGITIQTNFEPPGIVVPGIEETFDNVTFAAFYSRLLDDLERQAFPGDESAVEMWYVMVKPKAGLGPALALVTFLAWKTTRAVVARRRRKCTATE
jgi:hypothetical protein